MDSRATEKKPRSLQEVEGRTGSQAEAMGKEAEERNSTQLAEARRNVSPISIHGLLSPLINRSRGRK